MYHQQRGAQKQPRRTGVPKGRARTPDNTGEQDKGIVRRAEGVNAQRTRAAKATAGIQEETNTWSGWKQLGYEVVHGSKALFGIDLIWGSRGDGKEYKARFFGRSQVRELVPA